MQTSAIFDAAFDRRAAPYPTDPIIEALLDFEERCKIDPREPGEAHPAFEPLGSVMVFESPPIASIPRFALSYMIDDDAGIVRLLNIHFL